MCPVMSEAPAGHSSLLEQQTPGKEDLRQSYGLEDTRRVVVVQVLKAEMKEKNT